MSIILRTSGMDNPDNPCWFAILEAMGDNLSGEQYSQLSCKDSVEVTFVVNGIELDFSKVMLAYEQQWDECVARTARARLQNKFGDLMDAIDGAKTLIEDMFSND